MQSDELTEKAKDILCHYYGIPSSTSRLQISKTNLVGFFGRTVHYHLVLTNGEQKFRAFGKLIPRNDKPSCNTIYGTFTPAVSTEYNNLRYLEKLTSDKVPFFPRLIGLVNAQEYSLLLLEYLEGYSNLSVIMASLVLPRRERITQIVMIGKSVLNKLDALQTFLDINHSSPEPECKALRDKLDRIHSLPSKTKKDLLASITESVGNLTRVRKGIIHGDLGPRNISIGRSDIVFLDWEAMQKNRFSLYDPCYFVISLLMRCVQVFISQSQLDHISMALFHHMIGLEEKSEVAMEEQSVRDSVRLGKHLAQLHVLSSYERDLRRGGLQSFFKQRRRQIQSLVNMISQNVYDDKTK